MKTVRTKIEFAVKYPDGKYLGSGWKKHDSVGNDSCKGWRYASRRLAMRSAGNAGHEDPKIVRIVSRRCTTCGQRVPR